MRFMRRSINALALALALGLGLGLLGLGAEASAQTPSPQCVASALAGGTVNAITIPALPCIGTSALVLVTASGANTGAVTLQQIGQPALAVTKLGGAALAAGDIPVAGAVMLLQATGQQWVLLNPGTTGGVGVVPTVAALRGLTAGAASAAVTQGYNSAGDGGGATYQWASGSSCTDDSVTCIRPNSAPVTGRWLGVFPSGAVNLYQAGLVPSSSTAGDASGLMNAIWTAGLSVYVPPGEWHIKNQLLCKAGLELEGAGQFASIITIGAATNDFNLSASSVLQAGTYGGNGCQIDGVKLQFYQPSFGGMTIANIVHYPVAIDGGNSTASGNWIYGGSIGTGSPVQITNAWTCVSLNNTQALGEGAWHLGNVNCSDYAGGLTLGGVISTIWVANWDEETFGMTSDQALVYESQGESGAALAVQIGRCDGCSFGTFATFAHGFKQLDSGATRGPATDITGVNVGVLELDGDGATLINGGGYVRVGALYGTNSSADTAGKIKSNPGAGLYAYTTVGTLGVTDGAPSGDVSTSGAGVTVLTLGSGWYESLTVNSGASPWNFAGSNVTVVIGGINYIDPGGETVPQIVANCTCTVKFAGTNFTVPNSNRSAAVVSQAGAGTNLVMQGVSFTPGTSTGNVIAVGSDNVGNFLGSVSAHGWTVSLAGTVNGIYWLNNSVNNLVISDTLTATGLFKLNTGTFLATPSYTGGAPTQGIFDVLGSSGTPVTGQAAVGVFQKFTSDTTTSGVNQALYASITQSASGANVRGTAAFFEAYLTGNSSFGEGGRSDCFMATLSTNLACDGWVAVSITGTAAFQAAFGYEGVIQNNYQDTTAGNFLTQFNGSFIASPDGPHVQGAAYIINPNDTTNSGTHFLYGIAAPINVANPNNPIVSAAMIFSAQASTYVIDARSAATGSNWIALPNNSQIRINDSSNNQRNMVTLNGSNVAEFAADGGISSITIGSGATTAFSTGATNNLTISNASTYNSLSFGNSAQIQAGGGVDQQMYLITGANGSFDFRINGVDDTLFVSGSQVSFGNQAKLKGYTVAGLPAGIEGAVSYVTDQLTSCPAFGGTFTGGGSVKCFAFYNGSAWVGG